MRQEIGARSHRVDPVSGRCLSLRARKLQKLASPTTIGAWPVDPPAAVRQRGPEKAFGLRRPRVVVECGGTLVKSPRVGSVPESQPFAVEVVAKLVAERREKRAERGDSLLDGRAHPNADQLLFQMVEIGRASRRERVEI